MILRITIFGETHETTFDQFVIDNDSAMHRDDMGVIAGLQPGDTYLGGGGAAVEWSIERCV